MIVGNVSSLLGHSPEDYELEESANSDEEVVELEVDFVDHCGRVLACTVFWNAAMHEGSVVAWDEHGHRVELDPDTAEAICMRALL